jgi:hypothetical protein
MPCRIEQYSPAIRRWLLGCPVRPKPERFSLRCVKVVHRKIEVYLLGNFAIGPGGRLIVRYAYGGQPDPVGLYRDELVVAERDLSANKRSPECRQRGRVSTVHRDGSQPSYSHSQ